MLKLLLREDRRAIKKEFLFRFLNIFLWFSIIGVLVTCILLFTSYVFIEYQKRVVDEQLIIAQNSGAPTIMEQLRVSEEELKKHYQTFKSESPEYSKFLLEILNGANDRIFLEWISFKIVAGDRTQSSIVEIELRGQAETRKDLVEYVEELRLVEIFEFVNLPLSNLTRDTEVPFVISIRTTGLNIN